MRVADLRSAVELPVVEKEENIEGTIQARGSFGVVLLEGAVQWHVARFWVSALCRYPVVFLTLQELLADSDKISFLGQDMFFLGQAELIWGINF